MQIVGWADFDIEAADDGLSTLQQKLTKSTGSTGAQSLAASSRRLEFDRTGAAKRLGDAVKTELIAVCNQQIGISMYPDNACGESRYIFEFSLREGADARVTLYFNWGDGLHAETATLLFEGVLIAAHGAPPRGQKRELAVLAIGEGEELTAREVANGIATVLGDAVDLVEVSRDLGLLHGSDIVEKYRAKE